MKIPPEEFNRVMLPATFIHLHGFEAASIAIANANAMLEKNSSPSLTPAEIAYPTALAHSLRKFWVQEMWTWVESSEYKKTFRTVECKWPGRLGPPVDDNRAEARLCTQRIWVAANVSAGRVVTVTAFIPKNRDQKKVIGT